MKQERGNWRPLQRDELRPERRHDAYKEKAKLPEPTQCPDCGAIWRDARWQWGAAVPGANEERCPACHRIHDDFPAGFVSLGGEFLAGHRDEVLQLVRHREAHEKSEHPLERIIAIRDEDDGVLVTTTDTHLARDIGEAVHSAYKGMLEYHYNDAESLLRVRWVR
jgi:hypothetical protein